MLISADIGNSFAVAFNGSEIHTSRSVIAPVSSPLNARKGTGLITYEEKQYHVGDNAFKYDMYRMMATNDKQVGSSYTDSLILLLNIIAQFKPVQELTYIIIQVPDTFTSYHHDFVKLINGIKVWSCDNQEYYSRLVVKAVYQEGFGSWYMAKRADIITDIEGYTIVIDIGGGTVITTLIANDSEEVLKTYTYRGKGMVALANLLVQDYDLILANDGVVITIEQVFKGFEDETYRIGLNGANFKPFITRYVREWWLSIWQNVVNTYKKQLHDRVITKVLVTGGGAHVVKPFVEATRNKPGYSDLFEIAHNPLLDNVIGIYHAQNDIR
jgi:hypothetical protein